VNWIRSALGTAGVLIFCLLLCPAGRASTPRGTPLVDGDRDGLDDRFEQALLEKFAPVLHLSAGECDGRPAEFRPGTVNPELLARNGTIYGQVFRRADLALPGAHIEVHYYHLWGRDCGRSGHLLDAEHVSALLEADGEDREAGAWKAVFWYASAHQDTVCDLSSAAKAPLLAAEQHGPEVWISRGNHASFFSQSACLGGCGGDVCEADQPLHSAKIINIGERGAWLNGCSWAASGKWPLVQKLGTDFSAERLAQLGKNESSGIVTLKPQLRRTQAVLATADSTAGALETSGANTGAALSKAGNETDRALTVSAAKTGGAVSTAGSSTGNALASSVKRTGRALRAAVRGTGRFLGIGRE